MRLDPTTAAGIDSPMGAALALLAERDVSRDADARCSTSPRRRRRTRRHRRSSQRVVEVARAPDGAAYTPVPGIPPLRRAIADELSRDYAGSVEPADVVVTAGCNQAFSLVADALAGPGDEVITPLPYYFNHDMWLRMHGVRPVYLEPDAGLVPRAADAEALVTPRTRAIVLITPGNPSGVTIPPAEIAAFAALARRHDIALILDETYRSFRDTAATGPPVVRRPGLALDAGQPALVLQGPRHPRLPGRVRRRRARAEPRGAQADGLRRDLRAAGRAGGRARRADPGRGVAAGTRAAEIAQRRAWLGEVLAARPGGFEAVSLGGFFAWVRHPFTDRPTSEVVRDLVLNARHARHPGHGVPARRPPDAADQRRSDRRGRCRDARPAADRRRAVKPTTTAGHR